MFTKILYAWLLIGACAFAGSPSIEGSVESSSAPDNTIRVKVGTPPWVVISVKDAPTNSSQKWSGPIGDKQVGMSIPNGVAISSAVPGAYHFRCILQTPKEGLDDVEILETMVVVEGSVPDPDPGPGPDPVPVPVGNITELVIRELKPVVAANPGISDKTALAAVALAYRQTVAEINEGKITTVDQLLDRTKELTLTALKDRNTVLWKGTEDKPGCAAKIEQELQRLSIAGKLPDLKSHIPYWEQVSQGINKAIGI